MLSRDTHAHIHGILISLGSVCLGLVLGIVGPTLLDLGEIYGVDTVTVSQLFTTRSIGMMIGAVIASAFLKRKYAEIILAACLIGQGLGTGLIPIVRHFWLAHASFFITGVAIAFYEIASNVALAQLWTDATFDLQLYQLGYGLGTVVIPFAAEPFLSSTGNHTSNGKNESTETLIYIPYGGVGLICVLLAICMIGYSHFVPLPLLDTENSEEEEQEAGTKPKPNSTAFTIVLVILMAALILFDTCVESCFTGMLTPFVVNSKLHLTKSVGAYLNAVFRSTFTLGRLFTVICFKYPLNRIIAVSLTFLGLSSIILSIFVEYSVVVVWAATAGLGLGLSTLFGSSISWTCQYVVLQPWHMSLNIVATCLSMMAPSILVAPWIDSFPMVLMYVLVGLVALLWIVYGSMLLTVKGKPKRV